MHFIKICVRVREKERKHIWSVLSFFHVDLSDEGQVIRFGGKHIYQLSHTTGASLMTSNSHNTGY